MPSDRILFHKGQDLRDIIGNMANENALYCTINWTEFQISLDELGLCITAIKRGNSSPVKVGTIRSGSRACSILVTMTKITESLLRLYLLRHVIFDLGTGQHDTPALYITMPACYALQTDLRYRWIVLRCWTIDRLATISQSRCAINRQKLGRRHWLTVEQP